MLRQLLAESQVSTNTSLKPRHSSQTTTTFCLINVSGRLTYSSVHCRWQSVSCCSRSSVEQSSIARHCCPPPSPSSAVVLNHISSHFLIPLSDSSLICTVPVQWLVILDDIVAFTFILTSSALTLLVDCPRHEYQTQTCDLYTALRPVWETQHTELPVFF